jgi:uncharacterized protein
MNFKDQVILITGASNGIGRQLALDLAARGAVVAGCGRSIARLKAVLKEVRQTSPSSVMIGCDVSDPEQVKGMVGKVLADYGKVDILVNNAGVGMRRPFVETPLATIEEIMRTNYLGAVCCAHEVLPSMIARSVRPYRQHLFGRRPHRHAQHGRLLRFQVRHERLVGKSLP